MKISTLRYIKSQVRKYIPLIEKYRECHKDQILISLEVEICNFCHNWEDCHGYSFIEDLRRVECILDFLEELKKVEEQYHFVVYICEQVQMTYDGNRMAEDETNYEMVR